jgi:hypothetical protein
MPSAKYSGTCCPNCESGNINGDALEFCGMYRPHACRDCGATWNELLQIVGYSSLVVPDENDDKEHLPWHMIEMPEGMCSIGKTDNVADQKAIKLGLSTAPGYSLYTGFRTEEDVRTFAAKKNLVVEEDTDDS